MPDGLAVPPDVDLVVVVLRGFAVDRVVEVHALGVFAPPVPPHQVAARAEESDDHCGKDRHDRNDYPQNRHGDVVPYEVVITGGSM